MRLLICAGGTGGGVYPALAVHDRLKVEHPDVQTLWVGTDSGMESGLVPATGIEYKTIPAAGLHGVGLRRLPGNLWRLLKGFMSSRRLLRQYKPDVLFFTGGYMAVPMALAGLRTPKVLYVPDIEPGLALKTLSYFADVIAVSVETTKDYLPKDKQVSVSGYPVRPDLSSWEKDEAYQAFNLSPDLPTLLVTGGSLGSLTINQALVDQLPVLLEDMQVIHLTGKLTWPQFENVRDGLPRESAERYRLYPYLHNRMGAAFRIADLVLSRAGASSIGEYPHFNIPAILVPYPYAWRYQKVNADYLVNKGAAILLEDAELPIRMVTLVKDLMKDNERMSSMKAAMQSIAVQDSASVIADLIHDTAVKKNL